MARLPKYGTKIFSYDINTKSMVYGMFEMRWSNKHMLKRRVEKYSV
jgi:hypothetical protein